jgi:hypothetical protein
MSYEGRDFKFYSHCPAPGLKQKGEDLNVDGMDRYAAAQE